MKRYRNVKLDTDINETDELMFTEDFDELSFADNTESTENTTVDADAVKPEDTTEEQNIQYISECNMLIYKANATLYSRNRLVGCGIFYVYKNSLNKF